MLIKSTWRKSVPFAMTAGLLALTACSSGGDSGSGASESAPAGASASLPAIDPWAPLPEKTTISIFKVEPDGDPSFLALPEGETLTDNRYITDAEKKFNLDIQFPVVVKNAGAGDKANLMIASNDITDVMTVSYTQYRQMVDNDMLADLTQVYNSTFAP